MREDILREDIYKQNLLPDAFNVGVFINTAKEVEYNKRKFLDPSWVFHDSVVKNVLEGNYFDIKPYSGEFVPTLNCSYRCRIPCSYMEQKKLLGVWNSNNFTDPQIHMCGVDFAKHLLDKLRFGGIKGLIFTGGGEPSFFIGIEDIMLYAKEIGIDTVLYSNGDWIDEGRVDKVIQSSPLLVRISLNAGTKETYNRFHHPCNPELAFETALSTIEKLAKGAIQNPSMSIGVSVVINSINSRDLIEVAHRIKEIVNRTGGGIEFLSFRPAFNYHVPSIDPNGLPKKTNQLRTSFLQQSFDIIEENVKPVLEGTIVNVSNLTYRYKALIDYQRDDYARYYDSCRASGLFVELAPDGKLHLCCDWNCHPEFIIGDLTKNTLHEIWAGDQRKNMLNQVNSRQCGICPPACKPHEINKQFAQVEMFRAKDEHCAL